MPESSFGIDPNIKCPVNDVVCPKRQLIVELYSTSTAVESRMVAEDVRIDDPRHPSHDSMKMQMRLAEHGTQVESRGCEKPDENTCGMLEEEPQTENRIGRILINAIGLGTK